MTSSFSDVSSKVVENKLRRPLSRQIELGIGAFLIVGIVLIALLALLFLSHSNRVATKGYELKMLQNERVKLIKENEILSMQIADLQSLEALENDEFTANMVKAEKPKYIRGDTAVASGNVNSQ